MSLNPNALVSLSDMKNYLNIPALETGQDALVESFINSISSICENYCNRKFIEQTFTERLSGSGDRELMLNNWPINSITSIYVDNKRVFGVDTLIDPSNYEFFNNEKGDGFLVQRFDEPFQVGRKNIKIIYKAGYTNISSLPSDISLAAKIAVAFYYEQQQQKNWTFSNKQKGEETITLVQGIPESSKLILDYYKRLEIIGQREPDYRV